MASAAQHSGHADPPAQSERGKSPQDRNRLLPVLAAERALRAVLLVGVGVILLTHAHADWAELVRRFAEQLGFDPSRNETGKLISRLAGFAPRQLQRDGAIALGYGALEALESYGLFRRRPWGEYLTVISTALLLIPEAQELLTHPTGLKVGGLVLNAIIVVYLIIRLIRRARTTAGPATAPRQPA